MVQGRPQRQLEARSHRNLVLTAAIDDLEQRYRQMGNELATVGHMIRTNPIYLGGDEVVTGGRDREDVFGPVDVGLGLAANQLTRVGRHLSEADQLIKASMKTSKRTAVLDEIRELKEEVRELRMEVAKLGCIS